MDVLEPQQSPVRTLRPVFAFAAIVVVAFALFVSLFPLGAGRLLLKAQDWAALNVGWYYLLAMTLYLVFVVGVALSKYGGIKLGADHDEPEFSYLSWAGMLFAAGISITLFFFCVSEPLTHYLQPPQGDPAAGEAGARQAMQLLFLHWGLHGWGVFALAAMAMAYFAYRHNLPLALRSALYPLIGKRINGPIGYTVDALGIVATVFGIGADMGFGVLHLNAGLAHLFNIPHSNLVQIILVVSMMGAAVAVAVSGVEKGVRWMANINMLLAIALVLFMLFAGPTQYLFSTLMQNLGDYLGSVVGKSFDVYAYGGRPEWLGGWTVFYWAWWIGWAPFVGLFIARISRGRTIREFVFGVLLIPLGFTLAWLSIFGNSALDQVLHHGQQQLAQLAVDDPPTVLYALLDGYPWSRTVIAVTVLVSFIFFVTSADSGAVVLSTLSSHGGAPEDDGPRWLRVFWGTVIAVLTAGLLLAGSIDALKSAVVLASLPFSAILLLMMWGLTRAFSDESHRKRALQYRPSPLIGDVREFVFGVLLIPLGFTLAWLSIFGNSALDQVLHHGQQQLAQLAVDDPPTVLYALLDGYPWSRTVIAVTVLVSFIFFVTSADSGAVVLSTLSSHGGAPEDDGPRWLRVFWGTVIAVLTAGLLLAGSIDALKSAVVLASLPFSAILLLMMWGLTRAFSDESHRKRALQYRPSPLIGDDRHHQGWRQRLSQAMHFPVRDQVYRFMDDTVKPAMEAVAEQLRGQGWDVATRFEAGDMELTVNHGEQQDFLYRVILSGYLTPSFAAQQLRNQRYYRAEVHLFEGSQDYDLVGYSRKQIINDIISQYERHLQFLHLSR
ncbi:BCCT family transporter [Stenotrophomonas maltophilia]|uniref:BCCT family transporter n=4 Tax=Gammaproteobacteria TaxID=1236 RepID=UPI003D0320AF